MSGPYDPKNTSMKLLEERISRFSNSCRVEARGLHCYPAPEDGAVTSLVCDLPPGEPDGAALHSLLVAVTAVVVLLTLGSNLLVLLTLYRSRQLHTVVNYLLSLLCLGKMVWTVTPIIMAYHPNFTEPVMCYLKFIIVKMTHETNFFVLLIVSILRYFAVVHGRSCEPTWKNIAAFTFTTAVLIAGAHLSRIHHSWVNCMDILAYTPQMYAIKLPHQNLGTSVGILLLAKFVVGFGLLGFAHLSILRTTRKSRRILKHNMSKTRAASKTNMPGTSGLVGNAMSNTLPTIREDGLSASTSTTHAPGRNIGAFGDRGLALSRHSQISVQGHGHWSGRLSVIEEDQAPSVLEARTIAQLDPENSTFRNPVASHAKQTTAEDIVAHTTTSSGQSPLTLAATSNSRKLAIGKSTVGSAGCVPTSNRIDILAGITLVAMLVNYFVSFAPVFAIASSLASQTCMLYPSQMIVIWIVLTISSGLSAISDPIICLIFSKAFRTALKDTCKELKELAICAQT